MDVAFNEGPMPHKVTTAPLVCADCLAGVVIVFEDSIVLKAGV